MQSTSYVFIGGCGRSGTTLLGGLLGNRDDTVCIPESIFKADLFSLMDIEAHASQGAVLQVLRRTATANIFDFSDVPHTQGHPDERVRQIFEWFVAKHIRDGTLRPRNVVDHTPHNLEKAARILKLYPSAKFIHIIRDGRAVAASMKKVTWGSNTPLVVARDWVKGIAIGLAAEEFLQEQVFRIRYERLVEDPENTLRELCDFLQWDFQPQMVVSAGYRPPAMYVDQHALVGQAVQKDRGEAWQQELADADVEAFEAYAGAILQYLGYSLKHPSPRYPRVRARAKMWMHELSRVVTNKYRLSLVRRASRRKVARTSRGKNDLH